MTNKIVDVPIKILVGRCFCLYAFCLWLRNCVIVLGSYGTWAKSSAGMGDAQWKWRSAMGQFPVALPLWTLCSLKCVWSRVNYTNYETCLKQAAFRVTVGECPWHLLQTWLVMGHWAARAEANICESRRLQILGDVKGIWTPPGFECCWVSECYYVGKNWVG